MACGVSEEGLLAPEAAVSPVDARVVSVDAGASDTGAADVQSPDTGTTDAGWLDASVADALASDTGPSEAATPDSSALDAGVRDAGTPETGAHEAGIDAGAPDTGAPSPASCTDLNLGQGTSTQTLYLGHDPTKPWTATCVKAGAVTKTYLTLPTGNASSYPVGGCASATGGSTGVVSTYSRVLFDPATLTVDTSDSSGATSTGHTHETSGNGTVNNTYDVMLFASARSCVQAGTPAQATVNLTGTHFVVDPAQAFPVQGSSASGSGQTAGAATTLSVNGFPAGISPCGSASDYYTNVGGACLKLAYAP
jgi:hypothetical protein